MEGYAASANERSTSQVQNGHDIIVVGASTGGVEALTQLMYALPDDLPASVFVVLHISPQATSHLPQILSRSGALRAIHPTDGAPIRPGRIYVAPPDLHLMVEPGRVRLVRGPRENRNRPAVDPLFRSAALAYGPRVIGTVLTGALDDGTAGLQTIKQRGGIAVVQDPKDALIPSMPESALQYVDVDYCLPLAKIGPMLARLAGESAPDGAQFPVSRELTYETRVVRMDNEVLSTTKQPGTLVGFTCPECGGPIYELRDGELVRYRCRVGHSFTGESMLAGQSEALEDALWNAYNTLQESALVAERMATDAHRRGHKHVAARLDERTRLQRKRAAVVRAVLGDDEGAVPGVEEDEQPSTEAKDA